MSNHIDFLKKTAPKVDFARADLKVLLNSCLEVKDKTDSAMSIKNIQEWKSTSAYEQKKNYFLAKPPNTI